MYLVVVKEKGNDRVISGATESIDLEKCSGIQLQRVHDESEFIITDKIDWAVASTLAAEDNKFRLSIIRNASSTDEKEIIDIALDTLITFTEAD